MSRCLCIALLLMSSPVLADDKVEIRHAPSLEPGETSRVVIENDIEQTLTIAGMPIDSKVEQYLRMDERVEEVTNGEASTSGSIDMLDFRLTLPDGREFNFVSDNPDQSSGIPELEPIEDLFRTLAGAEWTSRYDADHKLVAMEYKDDPFSQLDEAMREEVSPQRWLQMADVERARLPEDPVAVGDTWTRTEPMNLGSGQTLTFEKEYEYAGTQETDGVVFDRIRSTAQSVTYAMKPNPNLPLEVKESNLTVEKSEGELLYNRDLRMVTKTTETVHISGPMTLVANGQELPGELDLTMTFTTTVEPAE